ncbi:MAG: polysaccharide pyruvyl transferase family protein [Thermoanaerobaculia bacterium]
MSRARAIRIGISGSYGGMNLGDEAILHAMLDQIRGSLEAEVTVFTRNAEDTRRRHGTEAVEIRKQAREEALEAIRQLDVLVLGGGGILFDGEAEAFLREVELARVAGVPVAIYAVSAGPLTQQPVRDLVAKVVNEADLVTVRDNRARHLLEEVGVRREIEVTADPALLLEPAPIPEGPFAGEGVPEEGPIVGFSVREPGPAAPEMDVDHYHALLANAADFIVSRLDAHVLFVPMERKVMDMQHSHAVVARMKHADRASVLKGDYGSAEVASIVGRMQLAVGMRLHFLMFAAIQNVPFVALPYATKVEGFLEEMGMETPPLGDVSAGVLLAEIDRCWDHRGELRARIEERLPALQERARRTHELLLELIRDRVPS